MLQNWLPYKIFELEGSAYCRWLQVDERNFKEPFFEETISRYRPTPVNSNYRRCTSSLDILPEWSLQIDSIPPTAFIFHVSRCGSTLASQLLSLSDENIVLSEVPFFDEIARTYNTDELLKASIRFYGMKRNSRQSRVFIKTDSWHIFYYEQIRRLYPGIPFILLYRNPVEVIHSQQKIRGMQAVPGLIDPALFGFTSEEVTAMGLDEYMAKVLERYFESFLAISKQDPQAILVNYKEGGMSMIEKIAQATGMPIQEEEWRRMDERAGYHAKYPGQLFEKDRAGMEVPAYCKNAMKLYKQLEEARMAVTAIAGE